MTGPPPNPGRAYIAFAALSALATPFYHRVQVDDPYITFRYARNLAEHGSLVYNLGDAVLGTTSPLFAILLALPGLLTDRYDVATSVLNGCALAALAGIIYWVLSRFQHRRAGLAAGLLIVLSPLMGDALGFELNLYLALVFGGFAAYVGGRFTICALLLALGVLTRGDGMVPAGLILGHLLVTRRRDAAWPIAVFAAVVGAWTLYATAVFGSPFPNTLSAKRALGTSGLFRSFLRGGARLGYVYITHSPLYLAFLPAIAAGVVRIRRMDTRLWILFAWPAIICAAYVAMGIPSAYNYYAALVPATMILTGLGLDEIARRLADDRLKVKHRRWASWPLMLAPLLAAQMSSHLFHRDPQLRSRFDTYAAAGAWLEQSTAKHEDVALVEIGIVGFFSRRPIVDLCGLVTPPVAEHIAHGDIAWPVRERHPDYVLLHDPPWPALETPIYDADWFKAAYQPVRKFDGREPYKLALYKRRPSD